MARSSQDIADVIASSHRAAHVIMGHLSTALDIDLVSWHREGQASNCGLKLESVPFSARLEDVPPSEHRDQGSLTLLFCDHYTTEIQSPEMPEVWGFITPKPGHAIVNVADSLQILSRGKLQSCLHRVGQPAPGEGDRVCLLYYLRPEGSEDGIGVNRSE